MKLLPLLAITIVAGCAESSEPEQMGRDTYSLSAAASPLRGGVFGARKIALHDAGQYCRNNGREILVNNVSSHTLNSEGAGSVDVVFRCLSASDSEMQRRPVYQKSPDVVVENKN